MVISLTELFGPLHQDPQRLLPRFVSFFRFCEMSMMGSFLMIEHLIPPVEVQITPRMVALVRLDIVMPSLMVIPVAARGKALAANFTHK